MSRLQCLMDMLGISGRIIQNDEEIEKIASQKIDWEQVESNLRDERRKSSQYLSGQLQV